VIVLQTITLVCFGVILIRALFAIGMPRVGGKIGRKRKAPDPAPIPDGFAEAYIRSMRLSVAASDAAHFSIRKDFLRRGTREIPVLMRICRVAGCKTEIEIPSEPPGYERIDASEALALLRELPDLRLVRRLQLSDEPSFLDPWVRKITGQDVRHLGNATNFGLIVLYRPDRRAGRDNGLTLLHEWLHIVAFKYEIDLWRFGRANKSEPLAPPPFEGANSGRAKKLPHEAWSDLGEKLLGYDEAVARETALQAPLHAMILWGRIARILRRSPPRLRSTRAAEFERLDAFIRTEVAPKARQLRSVRTI
jgi:hypothetical protein